MKLDENHEPAVFQRKAQENVPKAVTITIAAFQHLNQPYACPSQIQ